GSEAQSGITRTPPRISLRIIRAILAITHFTPLLRQPERLQRLAVVLVIRLHETPRSQPNPDRRSSARHVSLLCPTCPQRRMSRKSKSFPRLRRWRRGARWARRKLAGAPRAARIVGVVAILLVLVALTNLVYHVIRKPTELF